LDVLSDSRWEGMTDAHGCHPRKRVKRVTQKGEGTAGKPILRLHLEWADLNGSK
jgi:hypothetical protein